jgi:hypothetical protein
VIILRTTPITPQQPFPQEMNLEYVSSNCVEVPKLPGIIPALDILQALANLKIAQYESVPFILIRKKVERYRQWQMREKVGF